MDNYLYVNCVDCGLQFNIRVFNKPNYSYLYELRLYWAHCENIKSSHYKSFKIDFKLCNKNLFFPTGIFCRSEYFQQHIIIETVVKMF